MAGARFPAEQPPIDRQTGLFVVPLLTWFRDIRTSVDATPQQVTGGTVRLTGQTDAIGTTAIPTTGLPAGLYAVRWYGQVEIPAGGSSDFQVTVSWTNNGVAQSHTGTLRNGNTTATNDPDGVALIHIDGNTPVSYSVAYNSNPANEMAYSLDLVLELVSAD